MQKAKTTTPAGFTRRILFTLFSDWRFLKVKYRRKYIRVAQMENRQSPIPAKVRGHRAVCRAELILS
jgi:hypothetical protein